MTKKALGFFILVLLAIATPSYSQVQQAPQPAAAPSAPTHDTVPVVIDGMTIFSVRGVQAYPAAERAAAVVAKIRKVADNPDIRTDSIVAVETGLTTDIVAGDEKIISLMDADAALEGVKRQVLARIYVAKLRAAVESYRSSRSPEAITNAIIYTAIATVAVLLALFLHFRLYKKAASWVESKYRGKVGPLHIKTFDIMQADKVWALITRLMRLLRLLIAIALIYFYVHLVLSFFPWTRWLHMHLLDFIVTPLKAMGVAVIGYIPNLIFIAILAFVARYVVHALRLLFLSIEKGALTFSGFEPEWARPTYKIARLAVVAFTVVVAYPYIPGSESSAFKGVSIFLGVLFSLGSSSAVSNIIAGYTLIYRRAFKVGDRVKIAEFTGDVTAMRVQVTHLRTIKNEAVIVPNSLILGSNVVNYSSYAREEGLILHTQVTIGYDAPWRQVEAMLLQAADRTQGLLKEPSPFVLQRSLDDFYVSYELNAYTDHPQGMDKVYAELHRNIQDAFNEYGVQIMSPHYLGDPSGAKVVPKEKWYPPPAKKDGAGGRA